MRRIATRTTTLLLTTAVALFGLAGCGDGVTGGDTSSMSLQLTDEPAGDLSQAWVDIGTIELQGQDGGVTLVTDPQGPDEFGGMFELTRLDGTTEELVSGVTVTSGTYTQLRVVIDAAAVEDSDGDLFAFGGAADALGRTADGTLQDASTSETGFKVNLPDGGITLENESKILVLDFDVSESYGREAGQSDMWVFKPLIRTSEIEVTGTVSGNVDDSQVSWPTCGGTQTSVEDFVAQLLADTDDDGADEVAYTGNVQSDGSYEIDFVEPGDYATGFADQVAFDSETLSISADVSTASVAVEDGATSTVNYTVTGVSCSGSSG